MSEKKSKQIMTKKKSIDLKELEEILKMMTKYNVSDYAQGELAIRLRKPAPSAVVEVKEPPKKTKEQEEEELLFYSSRG